MAPRTGTKVRRRRKGEVTAGAVVDAGLQARAEERAFGARARGFVVDRNPAPEPIVKTTPRKALLRNEQALLPNHNVEPIVAFKTARKTRPSATKTTLPAPKPKKKADKYDVWAEPTQPDHQNVDPAVDPEWWKNKGTRPNRSQNSAPKHSLKMAPAPDHALSVNPLHEPHQDRLGELVAVEMAKRHDAEIVDRYLNPDPSSEIEDEEQNEMSTDSMDDETPAAPRHVQAEKLTRAQRNKIRRKQEAARLQTRMARDRGVGQDIDRLDDLIKEVEEAPPGKKATAKIRGVTKKKKMGGRLVPSMPISTLLSDELSKSLRSSALQNNAIKDQFVAMQHHGLIEPRAVKRRSKKLRTIRKARANL